MRVRSTASVLGLAAVLFIAPVSRAQDTASEPAPERPQAGGDRGYKGLFGGHHQKGEVGQSLDARVSVYDAFDTLVPLGTGETTVSTAKKGTYPGASAMFAYSANSRKVMFEASSSTGTRLYTKQHGRTMTTESASAALVVNFGRSLVLEGYQA